MAYLSLTDFSAERDRTIGTGARTDATALPGYLTARPHCELVTVAARSGLTSAEEMSQETLVDELTAAIIATHPHDTL